MSCRDPAVAPEQAVDACPYDHRQNQAEKINTRSRLTRDRKLLYLCNSSTVQRLNDFN